MVPSTELGVVLAVEGSRTYLSKVFKSALDDPVAIWAQAGAFPLFPLNGGLVLRNGLVPHPSVRAGRKPSTAARRQVAPKVTLVQTQWTGYDWSAPTYRSLGKAAFITAIAPFEADPATRFRLMCETTQTFNWQNGAFAISGPVRKITELDDGEAVIAATLKENVATWGYLPALAEPDQASSAHDVESRALRSELEALRSQVRRADSERQREADRAIAEANRRAAAQGDLLGLGIAVLGGAILSRRG